MDPIDVTDEHLRIYLQETKFRAVDVLLRAVAPKMQVVETLAMAGFGILAPTCIFARTSRSCRTFNGSTIASSRCKILQSSTIPWEMLPKASIPTPASRAWCCQRLCCCEAATSICSRQEQRSRAAVKASGGDVKRDKQSRECIMVIKDQQRVQVARARATGSGAGFLMVG